MDQSSMDKSIFFVVFYDYDNKYSVVSAYNEGLRKINISNKTVEGRYGNRWYNAEIKYIGMNYALYKFYLNI